MDRFLIVANWKANQVRISDFGFLISENIEVVIAAPFTEISKIPEGMRAAQDISAYPAGAYTGEVPGKILADLGVKYCLIGHSERRKYLKETNIEVEKKLEQAIVAGITPILCAQTLAEIPENIRNFDSSKFLIMYEPFSAISTEGQYHPESVENIVATLSDWKNKLHLTCRFLYGGSISADNADNYLTSDVRNLISGFVVGHASLDPETFSVIITKCSKALESN